MKNGKYLTYPKIDREQTWNFSSVLSIFNFKCKIINQNVVINGSDVIDTSDKHLDSSEWQISHLSQN